MANEPMDQSGLVATPLHRCPKCSLQAYYLD